VTLQQKARFIIGSAIFCWLALFGLVTVIGWLL